MFDDIIKKKREIPIINMKIEKIKIIAKERKLKGWKYTEKNGNVYLEKYNECKI